MIELADRLDHPSVRTLLAYSIGFPTAAKIQDVCDHYAAKGNWSLLGHEQDGTPIGCVGVEVLGVGRGQVRHIAVRPEARGKGIGRAMLDHIRENFQLQSVTAVTDSDTVEFWRHCGFSVKSLGEQYFGVERFMCTLQGSPQAR